MVRYLLYDADCPFCTRVTEKISKRIKVRDIRITPLKSIEGKKIVENNSLENLDSIIYIDVEGKVYLKSKAIIKVCYLMKFPYNIGYIFNIFPKAILDSIYNFVARNRMKIKI